MGSVLAVIQARVGSTRLPGKVMYPLDGVPVLNHITKRASHANSVDNVVVATSTEPQDDVIAEYIQSLGTEVVRGDESNLLSRFERAIDQYDPDIVIRLTGDNPLVLPQFIDACIDRLRTANVAYATEGPERTFPLGTSCEAFTTESFVRVREVSTTAQQREHVTVAYKQQPDEFETASISARELFDDGRLQNRTDLRLTLDEPADYQLFRTVYDEVSYETILDIQDAITHIDKNELWTINEHVTQKTV